MGAPSTSLFHPPNDTEDTPELKVCHNNEAEKNLFRALLLLTQPSLTLTDFHCSERVPTRILLHVPKLPTCCAHKEDKRKVPIISHLKVGIIIEALSIISSLWFPCNFQDFAHRKSLLKASSWCAVTHEIPFHTHMSIHNLLATVS